MSDEERGTNPYEAPVAATERPDVARDRRPILHRGGGAVSMVGGGFLVYLALVERIPSARLLATGAILAAMGAWMVVFGYPRNAEGMAPAWWRAGLALTAIVVLVAAVSFASE